MLKSLLLFYCGACIASFITVICWRWPLGRSIIWPTSHCDWCRHQIAWYDLFPIVSYLILKGHSRDCGFPIHRGFFYSEIAGGCLFVLLLSRAWPWQLIYLIVLLYCLSLIDLLHSVMYPGPTLTAMVPLFISFWSNYHWLAAFLIGSALALLAYWTDAFGFGDVELLTILTLWFGLEFVLQSLLAGCILCLIGYAIKKIRRPHSILRGDQIPFIPYISMGVVVVMAF